MKYAGWIIMVALMMMVLFQRLTINTLRGQRDEVISACLTSIETVDEWKKLYSKLENEYNVLTFDVNIDKRIKKYKREKDNKTLRFMRPATFEEVHNPLIRFDLPYMLCINKTNYFDRTMILDSKDYFWYEIIE